MSISQKRITFFGLISKHTGRNKGGVAICIARLANYCVSQGLIVDIVMVKPDKPHFVIDQLDAKVNVHYLHSHSKVGLFWGLWQYVQTQKPTTILSFDTRSNHVASWLKCVPGRSVKIWASLSSALNPRHTKLFRKIYQRCHGMIAISNGLANDFMQLTDVNDHKMQVIYNPVITPEMLQMADESIDHPWLNNNSIPIIMGIGRLVELKGFSTLMQAFAQIRQKRPCRLIILGEGEQREQLETLAIELNINKDVALPGFQNNPWAWLKQADLFVLSSHSEGFGNVLAEALALGIPVVSTDCPFGPSEILEQGKYGSLVPVHDATALAKAMEYTLDHPLPSQNLQQAAQRFNTTLIGNQYLQAMDLTNE